MFPLPFSLAASGPRCKYASCGRGGASSNCLGNQPGFRVGDRPAPWDGGQIKAHPIQFPGRGSWKQREALEERTLMGAHRTGEAGRKDWGHHNREKLSHREGSNFLSLSRTGNHKERKTAKALGSLAGGSLYKIPTHTKSFQSRPTLRDPMECSPPGSSTHGFSRQE